MKLGSTELFENCLIGKRAAFHVACALCTADADDEAALQPGQLVRFTSAAFSEVRAVKKNEKPHAVVDPFVLPQDLKMAIGSGDLFLVLLFPGGTTSPRHHFDITIERDGDMDSSTWDCRNCNG